MLISNVSVLQVLTEDSSPEEVAAEAEGLVQAVLQGHNSVVMALGQSGSGKTHTMAGDTSPLDRTRTRTPGVLAVMHRVQSTKQLCSNDNNARNTRHILV